MHAFIVLERRYNSCGCAVDQLWGLFPTADTALGEVSDRGDRRADYLLAECVGTRIAEYKFFAMDNNKARWE